MSEGASLGDRSAGFEAANVLVLAPSISSDDTRACEELMSPRPEAAVGALRVDFYESPDDLLPEWVRPIDCHPTKVGVLDVGTRAASEEVNHEAVDDAPFDVEAESVANAGNLTSIGIAVTNMLDRWTGEVDTVQCCFRSLTPLLHYTDLDRTYQFIHNLTGVMSRRGRRPTTTRTPTRMTPGRSTRSSRSSTPPSRSTTGSGGC